VVHRLVHRGRVRQRPQRDPDRLARADRRARRVSALAAIGWQTEVRYLLRSGLRPLALGLELWIAVAFSSLILQRILL
jgi:uncharacterized membrane protein YadS